MVRAKVRAENGRCLPLLHPARWTRPSDFIEASIHNVEEHPDRGLKSSPQDRGGLLFLTNVRSTHHQPPSPIP